MGSGLSECISITGPLLLMQFHLVVLVFVVCAPLPPLPPLLSPASPAILQCPLSNGIKWSTKCAQGGTTMRRGLGEHKRHLWVLAGLSMPPLRGGKGGKEGVKSCCRIELFSRAQAECSGEVPAAQRDLHTTAFPAWAKPSPKEEPLWWPLSLLLAEFMSATGPKLQCWWM